MCRVLICTRTNADADAAKDRIGCVKPGMPIGVWEDGHVFGRREHLQQWVDDGLHPVDHPDLFYVVDLDGVPASEIYPIVRAQYETDSGILITDAEGRPVVYRYRAWSLDVNLLPENAKADLVARRVARLSTPGDRLAFDLAVTRIRDGKTFDAAKKEQALRAA